MGHAAIALAILGLALGLAFRLTVLLLVLSLLVIVSAIVAIGQGWGFFNTLLTIIVVQTIVQASYFVGILGRSIAFDKLRLVSAFDRHADDVQASQQKSTVFDNLNRKFRSLHRFAPGIAKDR
jgi:hypothetical protein